jgi:hypothetical protein
MAASSGGGISEVEAGVGLEGGGTGDKVTLSIPLGGVLPGMIALGAVDGAAILDDTVDSAEIRGNAVKGPEIATDAVDSDEIRMDAVKSEEIAAGAVGTSEIADGSVGKDDVDLTQLQARVQACPAGEAISSVDEGGVPTCVAASGGSGGTDSFTKRYSVRPASAGSAASTQSDAGHLFCALSETRTTGTPGIASPTTRCGVSAPALAGDPWALTAECASFTTCECAMTCLGSGT